MIERVSDNPRGDRRPARRDGDSGRRAGGSVGPRQQRRDGKPYSGHPGGKPHPAYAPKRAAPRPDDAPDTKSVRPRIIDPPVSPEVTGRELPKDVLGELRQLSEDNQGFVSRHLVMAAQLIAEDPELAHQHAISAGRKGGRLAVVRETLGITAYQVGDFSLALRELRTHRRISGSNDQLPLMVDSERGLGRPERALELGRSVPRGSLPDSVQVELAIAMSGARLDLGQPDLALEELQIPQLDPDRAFSWSPGLFAAMSVVLEDLGRTTEAAAWARRADVALAALDGGEPDDVVDVLELELDVEDTVEGASGSQTASPPDTAAGASSEGEA